MLWIGVHLPLLSLESFAATLTGSDASRPLALLEQHRIVAADDAAMRQGVRSGSKRATALALAPELLCGEADTRRDAEALLAVAHALLMFTPTVTLEPPNGVVLEVQPSLRVFHGLDALLPRLVEVLRPLGHAFRIACAPTALGATVLARWRDGFEHGPHVRHLDVLQRLLDDVPVWLLGPGREHWEALQGMGLATLGDLRQLPRGGIARRFGETLLADLDRAFGSRADPREPVVLPPHFDGRLELHTRADTTDQVLEGASMLLARLVAWAGAQQARIGRFALAMLHESRHRRDADTPAHTSLEIALAEPSCDAEHLRTLLRERLAHTALAAPTLELQLHCRDVVHAPPPNAELFPTRGSEREGLVRLVERLQARLGRDRVQRLVPVDDHRPERASVCIAVGEAVPSGEFGSMQAVPSDGGMPAAHAPMRPVWLLRQPLRLAERRSQPIGDDGRPLQLVAGPERIEAGWWDASLAARDYFVARKADGSLVWIYRARLPSNPEQDGWFLQGRFA